MSAWNIFYLNNKLVSDEVLFDYCFIVYFSVDG